MIFVASTLFLVAAAASIFAIFGSIAQSMPRIWEVIENRNMAESKPRVITIGAVRMTGACPASIQTQKMRQPSIKAVHSISAPKPVLGSNISLPLAA